MDPNQNNISPNSEPQTPPPPITPGNPYQNNIPQPSNTMAILGLVFAFLFAPLGLVFSIIGLKKSSSLGGKGKTPAIIGVVISIIGLLIGLLIFSVLIVTTYSGIQNKAKQTKAAAQESKQLSKTLSDTYQNDTAQIKPLVLGKKYSEPTGAYTITLPKDWEAKGIEGSRDISAYPSDLNDVSYFSLYIDQLSENEDFNQYIEYTKEGFDPKTQKIQSEKNITVNGLKGYEFIIQEDTASRLAVIYSLIVEKNGKAYQLTYSTSPERSEAYLPLFKEAAQTLTIK